MKKTLLLGSLGAAAAIGATAIHVIPVQAQESDSVQISVTVKAGAPTVSFDAFKDGESFTSAKIGTVKVNYSEAVSLKYTLTHYDLAGRATVYQNFRDVTVGTDAQPASGVDTFELDVTGYEGEYEAKYGRFVLTVEILGHGVAEDSISFSYVPIGNGQVSGVDSAGNPIIDMDVSEDTEYVEVGFEQDGEIIHKIKIPAPGGKVTINLADIAQQLKKDGVKLKDGKYKIIVTPYDKNGNRLNAETLVYEIDYKNSVYVPDTGITSITEKGLSDTDIIAVCSVLFGAAAVGGVAALAKTRRHNVRR